MRFCYLPKTAQFCFVPGRGIPVYISTMFFLAAGLVALPFWRTFTPSGLVLAAAFVLVALASLLVHEYAHALAARRYGVGTEWIEINVMGGLAHLRGRPWSRLQDMIITAAGPASNAALAAVLLLVLWALSTAEPELVQIGGKLVPSPYVAPAFHVRLLTAAMYVNAALCLINLIPALPLDGGRLLYLALHKRWPAPAAMMVVSSLGVVFSVIGILFLIGTLLSGFPIVAPVDVRLNWNALRAARRGFGNWDALVA